MLIYKLFSLESCCWSQEEENMMNPTQIIERFSGIFFLVYTCLRETLANWVAGYESGVKDKHLKYFVYAPDNRKPDDDAMLHYQEFKFESGKSFSNVFYPEKDDVVKRLDFFSKNKEWYKKRGIPYTMGFLFYGAPGCGKTSTIKAIANHTQRHIVSVPLNKIKTAKELLNVFYNVRMNYKDIPLNQRLYVLEDIDAADLKEVEFDREKTAVLLEVLDGVMEMDGRMLIITTNYPERLDKALIRPGRIDMKVKFGLCTADNIVQMYQHYFEAELPSSFDRSRLQDDVYSPAEVTQVFLNNMHKPEEGLEQLASQTATNIRLEGENCPFSSSAPSTPSKQQAKEE